MGRRAAPARLRVPRTHPPALGVRPGQRPPPAPPAGRRRPATPPATLWLASVSPASKQPGPDNSPAACACASPSPAPSSPHHVCSLLDEPFAALDEFTRHGLQDDLRQLWQADRSSVIFVTHSIYEAAYLARRIVVMSPRPGRISAEIVSTLGDVEDRRLLPAYAELVAEITRALRAGPCGLTASPRRCFAIGFLALWEAAVRGFGVPQYIVPGPVAIAQAFLAAPYLLLRSLGSTLLVHGRRAHRQLRTRRRHGRADRDQPLGPRPRSCPGRPCCR